MLTDSIEFTQELAIYKINNKEFGILESSNRSSVIDISFSFIKIEYPC